MRLRTLYSNHIHSPTGCKNIDVTDDPQILQLRRHSTKLKRLLKATMDKNYESRLYMLDRHLLDPVVDYTGWSEGLHVLDISPFEMSPMHVGKRAGPHFKDEALLWWKQFVLWISKGKRF